MVLPHRTTSYLNEITLKFNDFFLPKVHFRDYYVAIVVTYNTVDTKTLTYLSFTAFSLPFFADNIFVCNTHFVSWTILGNQTLCELCNNKHFRKMMAKKSTANHDAGAAEADGEEANGILHSPLWLPCSKTLLPSLCGSFGRRSSKHGSPVGLMFCEEEIVSIFSIFILFRDSWFKIYWSLVDDTTKMFFFLSNPTVSMNCVKFPCSS